MEGPHSPAGPGAQPSDRDLVVSPVTFMSYNMTGADTVKCQWVRDVGAEHNVNFCALQEHFKTVKTTDQWFRKKWTHCAHPCFMLFLGESIVRFSNHTALHI